MASLRHIYYDDRSPNIEYAGQWTEDSNLYKPGVGFVYGSSQHRTVGIASLTFEFSGTFVSVVGRVQSVTRGDTNVTGTWNCFVDGLSLGSKYPGVAAQVNNFALCEGSNLAPGPHRFHMEVQAEDSFPVWVDRIRVFPDPGAKYSDHGVILDPQDRAFVFDSGKWENVRDSSLRYTTEAGTSVTVDFSGSKVVWITDTATRPDVWLPSANSQGSYTIDDSPPVSFEIPGTPGGAVNPQQQILFETDQLSSGPHRLKVTYLGSSTPLVLSNLLIEEGEIAFTERTVRSNTGDATPSSSPNVGAIVGGVLGGLIFLLALGIGFYFGVYRKRRSTRMKIDPVDLYTATGLADNKTPAAANVFAKGPQRVATQDPHWQAHAAFHPASSAYAGPSAISEPEPPFSDVGNESVVSYKARLAAEDSLDSIRRSPHGAVIPQVVRQHNDSGIRLQPMQMPEVLELPPTYTPS
ncbi:hypothetical protein FA15DRAFT_699768 [Coprinopsis marcescibilis]|uniref:Transmembrane protein n=1 Tax=Coprinopsis marcescibilis TaxID=230819 RepID=A0A5C3LCQ9_COPMA|nr:hypothetical protein FA15DRAFT_699768 [Coprinopsis marcescibilis]